MKRALVRLLKALLPLVIVAVAAFAAVTMIMNRPPVEILTPVIQPPGVRVHEVTLQDARLTVTSQGTVQPRTESQLVPEIAGRVTWVAPSFAEGGFFEAGDVLVRIDPFDYEQMLVTARSQLAQARLRLAQEEAEAEVAQREWDTLGRGDPRELALRKPQLEDAGAAVAAAEAGVERARRDLQRAEIVAPYAGRVRTKNVDIGQYVRVGDALATVYAVDVAEIRLPLPDDELAYLDLPLSYRGVERQAQPAVTLRATFAGETHAWNGRIVRTESEIDSVSRMVHAIAEVADPYAPGPNPNRPPLAVGMYVEAEIEGRTARDVAVLPRAALRGRDQVLVATPEDRLSFRTIHLLRTSTESVIVRAGLQAGELVVISPLDTPTDGMRVQLANVESGLAERRANAGGGGPRAGSPDDISTDAAPAAAAATETTVAPTPAATPPAVALATAGADRPAWLADLLQDAPAGAPAASGARAVVPGWVGRDARRDAAPARVGGRSRNEPAGAPVTARAGSASRPRPTAAAAAPPAVPRAPAAGPAAIPRVVAVASFASLNRQIDSPELGPRLSRVVAARLASADGITLADDESQARYVVRGGIQQVGPLVRVTARIVDTEAGTVLHAAKIDGTSDDRPALEADVAAAVIEHLAVSLAPAAAAASGGRSAGITPRTLAVLPFDDLGSGGADGVDLGAAIREAVAERVAILPAVAVVTRGADAAWAIGGGVQRIGSLVRVTARLTDVRSGQVVTAMKVDGTIEAFDDLQSRVAAALIESVRDAIGGGPVASGAPRTDASSQQEGRRS